MHLWICEGSHQSGPTVHQSQTKELGRVSVARLVKVPPIVVLAVSGDTLHAVPSWTDTLTAWRSAVDTIRYQVHFDKEAYSLPDSIHFLPEIKPGFLQPPSINEDDLGGIMGAVRGEPSAKA